MWLALETSGDCASVALGDPDHLLAQAELSGARRHAGALLALVDQALAEVRGTPGEIEGIVVGDGPGGFTGLRIAATMAKAMLRTRRRPLWAVSSLVAMAASAGREHEGAVVSAVADALRGQVFAGAVIVRPRGLELTMPPRVFHPEQLAEALPAPALLVIRDEGAPVLPAVWSSVPAIRRLPMAVDLLRLIGVSGGAQLIAEPADWEPEYGRPAEAQSRWEATHGRRLPDPSGHTG